MTGSALLVRSVVGAAVVAMGLMFGAVSVTGARATTGRT